MDRETLERLRDLGTDWGHTISYPQTKDVLAAVAEIEELRESIATYRKVEAQLVERVAVAESKLEAALAERDSVDIESYRKGFRDGSASVPWWPIACWSLACFALGAAVFA